MLEKRDAPGAERNIDGQPSLSAVDAESIIATVREPLLLLDADLTVVFANRSFFHTFRVSPEETIGRPIYRLGNHQWDIPALRALLEDILPQKTTFDDFQVEQEFPNIGRRTMLLNARELRHPPGQKRLVLLAIEDITDRVQTSLLRETYEREARISKSLQKALVPREAEIGLGYEVSIAYVPVASDAGVGGDFLDLFPLGDGRTGILIGDVSGKGVEVAAMATLMRGMVRAMAYVYRSPGVALAKVNDALLAESRPDWFVTVHLAFLDRHDGRVCFASAGHLPPAIVRKDGRVECGATGDMPLGILAGQSFRESAFSLNSGDGVILFTDGVYEARRDDQFFGFEGIERVAAQHPGSSSDVMRDALLAAVDSFAGGRSTDDRAVIVIRRTG